MTEDKSDAGKETAEQRSAALLENAFATWQVNTFPVPGWSNKRREKRPLWKRIQPNDILFVAFQTAVANTKRVTENLCRKLGGSCAEGFGVIRARHRLGTHSSVR